MSKSDKYVPTHRAPGKHKAARGANRAIRTTALLTGVAAAATGVAVSGGVLTTDVARPSMAADTSSRSELSMSAAKVERRSEETVVSRSDRRGATDATKAAALSVDQGSTVSRQENLSTSDPRDIAKALLPAYGFDSSQFSCLDSLYVSESNWRTDADNPTSSAYGIPQAMTSIHQLPADYMTSAKSQIRWGLDYIQGTYGTPCSAWSFKQGHNWY